MDEIKMKQEKVQIIKHKNPEPLHDFGDILYPHHKEETMPIGDGWYSKIPEDYYENKLYYPLTAVSQNPWEALVKLGVNCFEFKEQVQYECPFNKYIHYWTIPVFIFTDDIKFWINKCNIMHPKDFFLDTILVRKFYPTKVNDKLPFTKIQRALLGPGYTEGTLPSDGDCYLYDALVALDNGDFLGSKVWMWFNK